MTPKPTIEIHYCTQCNWLMRSAWMAQELLHTFADDLASVTLKPGTGGIFEIKVDTFLLWERKRDGGFPDASMLKQRVRDYCFPERSLGHVDRKKPDANA
ncbi:MULTISPECIES: SelT/SelW/SelH family protein [Enterobacterales]|mgnify:CR=1 FL=1|jgi:selenoprotein W-related protein|uniref:SelT/SelW/SelH family protein n=1 Tax=Enterobacterales TaxID=91347 RepID=UPI001C06081C|nr:MULTISPECIES: SelT/SelW/SelH family protein [Enterobacterales]MEC4256548.1 SelT/SelW/SelH family protein [Escherichia coli]